MSCRSPLAATPPQIFHKIGEMELIFRFPQPNVPGNLQGEINEVHIWDRLRQARAGLTLNSIVVGMLVLLEIPSISIVVHGR